MWFTPPPHYPQTPHTLPPSPNIWKCYTTYKQRMFPINRCSQKTSTLLLFYKLMVKIRVTKEECVFFYLRVYMLVGLCRALASRKLTLNSLPAGAPFKYSVPKWLIYFSYNFSMGRILHEWKMNQGDHEDTWKTPWLCLFVSCGVQLDTIRFTT